MKHVALVLVIMASGCTYEMTKNQNYQMKCEVVTEDGLYRCENKEVVCYRIGSYSISCLDIKTGYRFSTSVKRPGK